MANAQERRFQAATALVLGALAVLAGLFTILYGGLLFLCEDDWCLSAGFRAWILAPALVAVACGYGAYAARPR